MAACAGSAAVVALKNCTRAVSKSTDVTADLIIADYANSVTEDFSRVDMERGRGGIKEKRVTPMCHLSVNYAKKFIL